MANTLPKARCEYLVRLSTLDASFSRRRPWSFFLGIFLDCRKQTNKKSLCITHYKEEYDPASGSPRSDPARPIHNRSRARPSPLYEEQNETEAPISNSLAREGQIRCLQDGRRYILRGGQWQPLCKYDDLCTNAAQYEHLCMTHFEMTQQNRRSRTRYTRSSRLQDQDSVDTNDRSKRMKGIRGEDMA